MTDTPPGRVALQHWYTSSDDRQAVIDTTAAAQRAFDRTGIRQSVHRHPKGWPCGDTCRIVYEPTPKPTGPPAG